MAGGRKRTEAMSNVDTAWLRMEERNNLMMITGVLMFDAPLDIARFKQMLRERFLPYERFTMRIVEAPIPGQNPRWETDPDFNLDQHIHVFHMPPPGDKDMLQRLVSHMMSTPLDLSRPPWEFHIVQNFEGDGSALICRLHHAIADGIALVSVMLYMTDRSPSAPPPAAETPRPPRRRRGPLASLLKPFTDTARAGQKIAGAILHQGVDMLIHPSEAARIARLGTSGVNSVGKLLLMPPDPQTAFKGPLENEKRAAWTELIPLADVKAVGKAMGGTVNDVLLTAVAGALRRYLVDRGEPVSGLNIRAVIPVNLRPLEARPKLGNQFGLVFLALPIGIEDPVDRMEELKRRMDAIKDSPEAVVVFGILNAVGMAPQDVQDIVVSIFGTKATAVMTNVPGPRETMYMAGLAIREMIFWVPQSGRLGLGVSILSYANNVVVGIATDATLVADPDVIAEDFVREFADMRLLVDEVRLAEEWDRTLTQLEEEAARGVEAELTPPALPTDTPPDAPDAPPAATDSRRRPAPPPLTPVNLSTDAPPAARPVGADLNGLSDLAITANGRPAALGDTCRALTRSGQPCRNRALPGSEYCRRHQPA